MSLLSISLMLARLLNSNQIDGTEAYMKATEKNRFAQFAETA